MKEIQTKITVRYHLTTVRMDLIKKSTNNKCWWGCRKMGILVHCWWDCKMLQPLWKTIRSFLKTLNIWLLYYLEVSLLDIYPKKTKALIWKDMWTPMVTAVLFTIAEVWKQPGQPRCPSVGRILFNHKRECNLATCNNMYGHRGY